MKIVSLVTMSFYEIDQALENIAISFCHFILFNLLNYEIHCIVIGCFGEGGGGLSPNNFLEILVSSPRF